MTFTHQLSKILVCFENNLNELSLYITDHFTVVSLVAWPLNESETGVDLVLIETSLLFLR